MGSDELQFLGGPEILIGVVEVEGSGGRDEKQEENKSGDDSSSS